MSLIDIWPQRRLLRRRSKREGWVSTDDKPPTRRSSLQVAGDQAGQPRHKPGGDAWSLELRNVVVRNRTQPAVTDLKRHVSQKFSTGCDWLLAASIKADTSHDK